MTYHAATWLTLLGLLLAPRLAAQDAEDANVAEMDLLELATVQIELVTGHEQEIYQAPAVASVITAEEIEAMGATHLDEVLDTVPGLHTRLSPGRQLDTFPSVRGGQTEAQVLTLVNGFPINQTFGGGRPFAFQMSVANVARIEVIRGPGSAVYGADAFAGVINVITKDAEDIAGAAGTGLEAGVRHGSFDTGSFWTLYGNTESRWKSAFNVTLETSDGDPGRVVERDLQTSFDAIFGTDASRAPGPLVTRYETLDLSLGLEREPWTIRFWHWQVKDRGNGPGSSQSLDPIGGLDTVQQLLDVSYRRRLTPEWELSSRLGLLQLEQDARLYVFPAGSVLPVGADGNVSFADPDASLVLFTDGLIAEPEILERSLSFDSSAVYTGWHRHRLRLGGGVVFQGIDTDERQNFGPGVLDPATTPVVSGELTPVKGTPAIFIEDQDRQLWFVSLQDEWKLAERWELTAGVRYDEYSDFGGTLNPRLALVWNARPDLSGKVLCGSAFRAPSFRDLFTLNNPVGLGNPNLDPETVDTLELVWDYRPRANLRAVLNLFTYEVEGLIVFVPPTDEGAATAQNAKDQHGEGFEVELDWKPLRPLRLQANYAFQNSREELHDGDLGSSRVPEAPRRQAYVSAHWSLASDWSLNTRLSWVADRPRRANDPRSPVADYTLVDLTLRHKPPAGRWNVAFAVRNFFDKDAREPAPIEIPGDYPLPGRSFFFELRYRM